MVGAERRQTFGGADGESGEMVSTKRSTFLHTLLKKTHRDQDLNTCYYGIGISEIKIFNENHEASESFRCPSEN